MKFWPVSIAIGAVLVAGACSTETRTQSEGASNSSTAATTTSVAPKAVDPASFRGPVLVLCLKSSVSVHKLNLDTRQLVRVADFPGQPCVGDPQRWGFDGQRTRLAFSRDLSKLVARPSKYESTVGYFDSKTGSVVNVSAIVQPGTGGDFDKKPEHSNASFTDDGLFVFFDEQARVYKFFDITSRQIVKQQEKPDIPPFLAPVQENPNATCWGVWILPEAGRFIAGNKPYVEMDLPPAGSNSCEPSYPNPQVLNPAAPQGGTVASDPSGKTVVFVIAGKDGSPHIYKSNFANPDAPERLTLQGEGVLSGLSDLQLEFIGWE